MPTGVLLNEVSAAMSNLAIRSSGRFRPENFRCAAVIWRSVCTVSLYVALFLIGLYNLSVQNVIAVKTASRKER